MISRGYISEHQLFVLDIAKGKGVLLWSVKKILRNVEDAQCNRFYRKTSWSRSLLRNMDRQIRRFALNRLKDSRALNETDIQIPQ